MDEGSLPGAFRPPPAEYGPAPLLVFNDEHEGEAGEARITRVLEGNERVGYGGVFLHPRPGLMTEYLSARWFELMRHAVKDMGDGLITRQDARVCALLLLLYHGARAGWRQTDAERG
jgi:hypothetical protein